MDSSDVPILSLEGDSLSDSSSSSGPRTKPSTYLKPIQTGFLAIPPRSHSGSTTPSSALLTPSDDFPNPFSSVAISEKSITADCDLSGPLGLIDSNFGSPGFFGHDKHVFHGHGAHCGCLHDPATSRTMLELSLGLRRAATVLRHSPSHQSGSFCPLHHSVQQLDSLAM